MLSKTFLLGHVVGEVDVRSTQTGSQTANFFIETRESWVDQKTGEKKERQEKHSIAVFSNRLIDSVIKPYIHDGSCLFVEGQTESRRWTDSDGISRQSFDVVIRPHRGGITLLDD